MSFYLRFLTLVVGTFLSAQIAGAVPVYLLTQNNSLVTMDSANPGAATAAVAITGQGAFTIVGIDVRTTVQTTGAANPGVGSLWALGVNGANTQMFVINPATAVATTVGPVLMGITGGDGDNGWYFGHDPGRDRFRIMNAQNNYELNPNTITFVPETNLTGNPNVNGSAFESKSFGEASNIVFLNQVPVDSLSSSSTIAAGTYNNVTVTGVAFSLGSGLDIAGDTTLFATTAGVANLYTINRGTGAATLIGAINGNPTVRAITMPSVAVTIKVKGPKRIVTSASSFTVKGTAASLTGIDSVEYRIGKAKAKQAKGTTRWRARVRLNPGSNRISFTAIGSNAIDSRPARVTILRN